MSGDSWADLLYYLDQAACRGAGETADSAKGRAIFLRAARESAAAAIAAEREACAARVRALAEDPHGDIGSDFSGGWEAAVEEAEQAIRARGGR